MICFVGFRPVFQLLYGLYDSWVIVPPPPPLPPGAESLVDWRH